MRLELRRSLERNSPDGAVLCGTRAGPFSPIGRRDEVSNIQGKIPKDITHLSQPIPPPTTSLYTLLTNTNDGSPIDIKAGLLELAGQVRHMALRLRRCPLGRRSPDRWRDGSPGDLATPEYVPFVVFQRQMDA